MLCCENRESTYSRAWSHLIVFGLARCRLGVCSFWVSFVRCPLARFRLFTASDDLLTCSKNVAVWVRRPFCVRGLEVEIDGCGNVCWERGLGGGSPSCVCQSFLRMLVLSEFFGGGYILAARDTSHTCGKYISSSEKLAGNEEHHSELVYRMAL